MEVRAVCNFQNRLHLIEKTQQAEKAEKQADQAEEEFEETTGQRCRSRATDLDNFLGAGKGELDFSAQTTGNQATRDLFRAPPSRLKK